MSEIARMYYENTLDTFKTRLKTINTKQKEGEFRGEIATLKMIITLITNLLKESTND